MPKNEGISYDLCEKVRERRTLTPSLSALSRGPVGLELVPTGIGDRRMANRERTTDEGFAPEKATVVEAAGQGRCPT
jgi:hypothetical protein